MLGEVVIDDKDVSAPVHKFFRDRGARIGGDILQGRGFARRRADDDGIIEGAVLLQGLNHAVHRRSFLSDCDIDADDVFSFLVNDGIDGEGGFSRLPVADDQFALALAHGDHAVDRLDARKQGAVDVCTVENGGGGRFHRTVFFARNRLSAVERDTQGIDDAPQQGVADGHADDFSRRIGDVAFAQLVRVRK